MDVSSEARRVIMNQGRDQRRSMNRGLGCFKTRDHQDTTVTTCYTTYHTATPRYLSIYLSTNQSIFLVFAEVDQVKVCSRCALKHQCFAACRSRSRSIASREQARSKKKRQRTSTPIPVPLARKKTKKQEARRSGKTYHSLHQPTIRPRHHTKPDSPKGLYEWLVAA